MRKNSLIMEEMRPELQRLQKQYANDKNLYSQKMMALYKKNGYSMFGACLPTIFTLVIFFVALTGFNNYSTYQNQQYFYEMSVEYDRVINEGIDIEGSTIFTKKGSTITLTEDGKNALYSAYPNVNDEGILENYYVKNIEKNGYKYFVIDNLSTATELNYITLSINYDDTDPTAVKFSKVEYEANYTNLSETNVKKGDFNNNLKVIRYDSNYNIQEYDYDGYDALFQTEHPDLTPGTETYNSGKASAFIKEVCESVSAITFRKIDSSFLWVKNIWVADSPLAHPVNANATSVNTSAGCGGGSCSNAKKIEDSDYGELIRKLTKEKAEFGIRIEKTPDVVFYRFEHDRNAALRERDLFCFFFRNALFFH